jgi:alkylhydroperoxidase family enzyme
MSRIVSITAVVLCVVAIVGAAEELVGGRIPLVDPNSQDPVLRPVFDAIRSHGGAPLNIHRTIGNAPKTLKGFLTYAWALRYDAVSPRADRELLILRTTQLVHGEYEFVQHRGIGVSCGLTEAQIDALTEWRERPLFTDRQRALLAYTDEMLSPPGVSDRTFDELKRHFSPEEIVELTLTSGFYVGVAQFSRALKVPTDPAAGKTTGYARC